MDGVAPVDDSQDNPRRVWVLPARKYPLSGEYIGNYAEGMTTTRVDRQVVPRFADRVFEANCPTRAVLEHVTSKWGVLILVSLDHQTLRWSELQRAVQGVSDKMLAQTLRTLADDGFVRRDARDVVPPYVEYSLTPLGDELAARLIPLVEWIDDRAAQIVG